uniref:Uncharacterized protein n=1 Tax=Moniliophthora roreri TaxID=221103 RepID=A0A0W0G5I2_MONRR
MSPGQNQDHSLPLNTRSINTGLQSSQATSTILNTTVAISPLATLYILSVCQPPTSVTFSTTFSTTSSVTGIGPTRTLPLPPQAFTPGASTTFGSTLSKTVAHVNSAFATDIWYFI